MHASNAFQITCNMFKCKYEILNKEIVSIPTQTLTSVYISLSSIFTFWIERFNIDLKTIDNSIYELCVSDIFDIAIHYKNYFIKRNIKPSIIFYNDIDFIFENNRRLTCWLINNNKISDLVYDVTTDTMTNPEKQKIIGIIRDVCNYFGTICKYLEDVSYINTQDMPGASIIAYDVIKDPSKFYFIVSQNVTDYDVIRFSNMALYRIKHNEIITANNLFNSMIFRKFKSPAIDRDVLPISGLYLRYTAAYTNRLIKISAIDYMEYRKLLYYVNTLINFFWKVRNVAIDFTSIENAETVENDLKRMYPDIDEEAVKAFKYLLVFEETYFPRDYFNAISPVHSAYVNSVRLSQIDFSRNITYVDYSIGELNESLFRNHRINFEMLFKNMPNNIQYSLKENIHYAGIE